MEKYSTGEDYKDKDRYKKVKVTSIDNFNKCLLDIKKNIIQNKDKTPYLFSGPIDGVDEVLSTYANIAQSFPVKERGKIFGIFFDINPNKISYFTFRIYLALKSDNVNSYVRNLLYYDVDTKKNDEILTILENANRNNPSSEQHKNYLLYLLKKELSGQETQLKSYITKGVEILDLIKHGKRNYKNLSKMLKENIMLNPETHWLSNNKLFKIVKDAAANGLIKIFQANLNSKGKYQLLSILKDSGLSTNIIYAPKGTQKFSEASDLLDLFGMCIDTQPPSEKSEKYRVWTIMQSERFFAKPTFEHHGELTTQQLVSLTKEYKDRTSISVDFNDEANLLLMGDIPFGRSYLDARSTTFIKNLQKYANLNKIPHVVLCGDIFDGEHTREKRKLAFLQYLTEAPAPSLEQQAELAISYLSKFNSNLYSVISDGDWDIIEEKQRELINQKEFEYKLENKTKHIADNVKKSLRIEAIFESAKQYYDYFESKIKLSAKMGDTLNLNFPAGSVHITHMNIGQYFRRSLAKQIGVKEQQLINQLTAVKSTKEPENIRVKVSSHDNVMHAHMEDEKTLNLRVPSLESPDEYSNLPIQLRNAVQDMMHKAVAVRGKIPFPGSCHVKITKDKRILLTILNEKVIEIMKEFQDKKLQEEYIIFDLADAQAGSIAYRYDNFIKYMDYVKRQSEKMGQKPNTKVKRIAILNGDIIEGINYPTAMMRNSPTKLSFPQTQISYATEVIKPFFFYKRNNGFKLDEDIEKIVLTHGNHEYNSGFKFSGMLATHSLYQYLRGNIETNLSYDETKKKLLYSLYTRLDKDKLIFSSIGAFTCLGLNVYCTHSYGGGTNLASSVVPQEKWVSKIGKLAKKWDILIQGHYHKFSLGECAGKILLTFPSFTEISDFEYERGLNPVVCRTILHISSSRGVVIEILTKEFLDNYECKHELFKNMTIKQFHDRCTERALEPVDLSDFS